MNAIDTAQDVQNKLAIALRKVPLSPSLDAHNSEMIASYSEGRRYNPELAKAKPMTIDEADIFINRRYIEQDKAGLRKVIEAMRGRGSHKALNILFHARQMLSCLERDIVSQLERT